MVDISQLRVGTVLTNGGLPEPYVVVAVNSTDVYVAHFMVIEQADFGNWVVVTGARIHESDTYTTLQSKHLLLLRGGDRVRHKDSAQSMIIVRKGGSEIRSGHLVVCRTYPVADPKEWNVVVP